MTSGHTCVSTFLWRIIVIKKDFYISEISTIDIDLVLYQYLEPFSKFYQINFILNNILLKKSC